MDLSPLPFPALLTFTRVAHHLSFARAATELQVTPTAVSKTVKQLEQRLGIRLFHRTTRSVSLTESGRQLHEALLPALDQIRGALGQIRDAAERPHGALRISTSFVAYSVLIEPHVPEFLARYPSIGLEISIDNALTDIVSRGFDAGIRLGHALQRDMISVPLGSVQRRIVVGALKYLKRHPPPTRPLDLLGHDCIRQRLSNGERFYAWTFQMQRKPLTLEVQGRLIFDEMRSVVAAARAGCGLGYVFEHFAAEELRKGQLVRLLENHCPPTEAFHLYYPSRAQLPGKLRAFIDFFRAALAESPVVSRPARSH